MGPPPDRLLALKLVGVCAGMFAFGFAMAPLYDAFCALTGYGGKSANTASAAPAASDADPNRVVRVELLGSVARGAPFEFAPASGHIDVHPGGLYEAHYVARNLTDHPIVAQAIASIAPGEAAAEFHKTECFCFTTQAFAPNEQRDLKVVFTIAPELPAHLDTVSLSYTFFALPNKG